MLNHSAKGYVFRGQGQLEAFTGQFAEPIYLHLRAINPYWTGAFDPSAALVDMGTFGEVPSPEFEHAAVYFIGTYPAR